MRNVICHLSRWRVERSSLPSSLRFALYQCNVLLRLGRLLFVLYMRGKASSYVNRAYVRGANMMDTYTISVDERTYMKAHGHQFPHFLHVLRDLKLEVLGIYNGKLLLIRRTPSVEYLVCQLCICELHKVLSIEPSARSVLHLCALVLMIIGIIRGISKYGTSKHTKNLEFEVPPLCKQAARHTGLQYDTVQSHKRSRCMHNPVCLTFTSKRRSRLRAMSIGLVDLLYFPMPCAASFCRTYNGTLRYVTSLLSFCVLYAVCTTCCLCVHDQVITHLEFAPRPKGVRNHAWQNPN